MSNSARKETHPLTGAEDQDEAGQPLRYATDPPPEQTIETPKLALPAVDPEQGFADRCQQTLDVAEEAFAQTGSWVVFFREVLGIEGVVATLFPEPEEYQRFLQGPEHATLQEMLAAIRSQDRSKADSVEPERMITIRIPRSLHEKLQQESSACGLSINKLAISKLLLPIDPRFVPEQQGKRRGRRPGPQGPRVSLGRTEGNTRAPNAEPYRPDPRAHRVEPPQAQAPSWGSPSHIRGGPGFSS
jgi:predicted HicB family RNase H-like nuclease